MGTEKPISRPGLAAAVLIAAAAAAGVSGATQVNLAVSNAQSPAAPVSGAPIEYRIVVANAGDEVVTDIQVVDTVAAEVTAATADQDPAFAAGLTVTSGSGGTIFAWSATGLAMAPGDAFTFTITGSVGVTCQPVAVGNTVWVAARGASTSTEMSAPASGFALAHAYEINVTISSDHRTFAINLLNRGTATVMDLVITDTVPATAAVFASTQPAGFGPPAAISQPGAGTLFVWSASSFPLLPAVPAVFILSATPECSPVAFTATVTALVTGGTACGAASAGSPQRLWVQSTDTIFSVTTSGWAGDSWAVVFWDAADGEVGNSVATWRVWRSADGTTYVPAGDEGTGGGATIGQTDTRAFWDRGLTNGVTYSYRLQALSACGASAFSDPPTLITPMDVSALVNGGESGVVTAQPGNGYIKLSWPAASESSVGQYQLYRATDPGGPFPASPTLTVVNATSVIDKDPPLDQGLVNGKPYWYMFFPCCPLRLPSFVSATPYQPARGQGQPVAKMDTTTPIPRAVRIDWQAALPGTYGLKGYAIFRSDDGGSTTKLLGSVLVGQLFYVDVTVPSYGKRYLYIIRPVDNAGNLGDAYPTTFIDVVLPTNRTFLNRNRMRPSLGERLDIVYQITEPGRLRIAVWSPAGEFIRRLYDQEHTGLITVDIPFNSRNSGLPPLVWDGANSNGELVATGVYHVVLEINGKRDFRSVAVVR